MKKSKATTKTTPFLQAFAYTEVVVWRPGGSSNTLTQELLVSRKTKKQLSVSNYKGPGMKLESIDG
jgi:hypothetical protein